MELRHFEQFIKGPIEMSWVRECFGLGLGATKVGLALWYLARLKKRYTALRLDHRARQLFLVSPWRLGETLRKMESAGLVKIVKKGRGFMPEVNLIVE